MHQLDQDGGPLGSIGGEVVLRQKREFDAKRFWNGKPKATPVPAKKSAA